MSGGAVSGNSVSGSASYGGGGVYVEGTFTMSDGAVSGNSVSSSYSSSGGGVYVYGTFTMSGGAVSGNSVSGPSFYGSSGGGVYIDGNNGTFTMSGGVVRGNILYGTDVYGREVLVWGTFTLSGEARPERVFLLDGSRSITIGGPLSGNSGTISIDLGGLSYEPLTDWGDKPILQLDASYSSGNLAELKTYFTLGNATWTDPSYTETPITGYMISDGGLFVVE
jgi:hypothetical protein